MDIEAGYVQGLLSGWTCDAVSILLTVLAGDVPVAIDGIGGDYISDR